MEESNSAIEKTQRQDKFLRVILLSYLSIHVSETDIICAMYYTYCNEISDKNLDDFIGQN